MNFHMRPDDKSPQSAPDKCTGPRLWISWAFLLVEDVVYIGLGLLLGVSAITLLVNGVSEFVHDLNSGTFPNAVIGLLDKILLILLIVELLYTVQVSFRTHALLPEPFLLIGLIAAIRRVLVLTAQFSHLPERSEAMLKNFFIELSILTVLILAVSISLVLVHSQGTNKPFGSSNGEGAKSPS